jgi:uncharacterized protein (DUF934 family)
MAKLIRNRRVADDSWQLLKTGDPVPEDGDVIVPLALWRERGDALQARHGRTGVWLDSGDDPEALAEDVARLPIIAVNFRSFGDGRSFSSARLLRERYGYKGELRAVGQVIRDWLFFMERCGIDSFLLRDGEDPQDALQAFNDFPDAYQASVIEPLPLFRRRLAGSAS